jgi:hypothetical protein
MSVVGKIPDMSRDVSEVASGVVSGGFKICMYGKSEGFASRPSQQPKISHKNINIFEPQLQGGSRARLPTAACAARTALKA